MSINKTRMRNFLRHSSAFLTQRQTSIFSAAAIIMVMIALSRVLGLIRNRVLAHFFPAETLAIYFAAFRLPEVVFEILVFGTLASAFIPTFTAYLSRQEKKEAWYLVAVSFNFALLVFTFLALLIFLLARPLYQLIVPGFTETQIKQVASLSRILLLAQGFFVLSYFLTGILESLQRFLVPALAPLFYNLGIILGAFFLSERLGIYGPTIGAALGAFFHFLIQLPLALYLGFRPKLILDFSHPGVREIGRLALPRIIELIFLQIGKSAELFLASLVSTAAYTYFTFANSLQLLPIGLFAVSIAKASLPALSYQSARQNWREFKETFLSLFNEILFFIVPCSVFLAVLRIPLVRLVFGAARFTWEATVQTGYTLSAFSLGVLAQGLNYLLTRAFYALHDSKTPVKISIITIFISIFLGAFFTLSLKLAVWSLALAFSLASITQTILLFSFLSKRLVDLEKKRIAIAFIKITLASLFSGGLMFFFLKILDRSVWDKKLSFLGRFGLALPTAFNRFVFDTRYTSRVIFLTALIGLLGLTSYLFLARLLKIKKVAILVRLLKKFKRVKEPIIISSE